MCGQVCGVWTVSVLIFLLHPSTEATSPSCGSTLTDTSGAFSSPNFPQNYDSDLRCNWTIAIGVPVSSVVLTFDTFKLEYDPNCEYDYVEVWERRLEEEHLLGRFCGNNETQDNFPPAQVRSESRQLTVMFRSDAWVTSGGFNASYVSNASGDVTCDQYEFRCSDSSECVPIVLSCNGRKDCWDGSDESGCGLEGIIHHIQAQAGTCHPEASAFICTLLAPECENNRTRPPCYSWCQEVQEAILLPNCAAREWFSQLQFPSCDTFPHEDCYNVEERQSCFYGRGQNYRGTQGVTDSGQQCMEWQSAIPFDTSIESAIRPYNLEKNYCRNPYNSDRPWCYVLKDTFVDVTSKFCNISTCEGDHLFNCGVKYTNTSGWFASPGFPQAYGIAMQCKWEITVAQTYMIEISFTDFDLQPGSDGGCLYDKVEMFDGDWPDGSFTSLGKTEPVGCAEGTWLCADRASCVLVNLLCDGNPDCWDRSDEQNCECQQIPKEVGFCPPSNMQPWPTIFPNLYNHQNVTEVLQSRQLRQIFDDASALTKYPCHLQGWFYTCYSFFPVCSARRRVPPCRSWCIEIRDRCQEDISAELLELVPCNDLPSENCWEGTDLTKAKECYYGSGQNYRGSITDTVKGKPCIGWESRTYELDKYPWANLEQNYCRNPDGAERPWCYVGEDGEWDYCNIEPCSGRVCPDRGVPRRVIPLHQAKAYYWPGEKVSYSCEDGFTLVGPAISECQRDAKWDPEEVPTFDERTLLLGEKLNKTLYNPNLRPNSDKVIITVEGLVSSIVNVDETIPSITTDTSFYLHWNDPRLDWEPSSYGDLQRIEFPANNVWRPSIQLLRNANPDFRGFPDVNVAIKEDGEITWTLENLVVTTCDLNQYFFPFDNMTCPVCVHVGGKFMSGDEQGDEIRCREENSTEGVMNCSVSQAVQGGEWVVLVNMEARDNQACLMLHLRRKPTYHLCTTVTPFIVLSLLMCVTFFIPPDSGDRLGYGMTILLSMFVNLVVITDFLPRSGNIPFIGIVNIVAIVMMSFFMLVTTWVVRLSRRETEMSQCTKVFFLAGCARLVLLGDMRRASEDDKSSNMDGVTLINSRVVPESDRPDHGEARGGSPEADVVTLLKGLQAVMKSNQQSLEALRESLEGWKKGGPGSDDREAGESDWERLAHVLDRLCLIFYLGGLIASVPIIFYYGNGIVI
ncbi:hypothetical protein Bbelb_423080 [Branchiostoma belcheri]|nr:hypothetical protein Bbelb_423080 [Branchiostoma belcheri]